MRWSGRQSLLPVCFLLPWPACGNEVPDDAILLASNNAEEFLLAASQEQDLFLETWLGDVPTGYILHIQSRDARLYALARELQNIGLVIPQQNAAQAGGWLALDSLPGLAYRYDVASQSLFLQAPPALRRHQRLGYQLPEPVQVHRDSGLLYNYDIYARRWESNHHASLASSFNWFGTFGSVELTGVSRTGDQGTAFRRLTTSWNYSDPDKLWTWAAGDLVSGGQSWSRPVRMAGVQWRRNFSTRPEMITMPMPSFDGSAALPSSVELYVNNRLQYNGEVEAGPFVLDTLPRINGAGTANLIVTDMLGRTVETSAPLYTDQRLLAPGLTDFSIEAGVLRYSSVDSTVEYGSKPVVSGSWMRGLSASFTLQTHAEAASRLGVAGAGGVWAPGGRWGLVSASVTYSENRLPGHVNRQSGQQYSLGYQWYGPLFGIDLSALRRSRGFHDLADLGVGQVSGVIRSLSAEDRVTLWRHLGRGTINYSYLRYREYANGQPAGESNSEIVQARKAFHSHSLSFNQNVGHGLSLSASVFKDSLLGAGVSLQINMSLGSRVLISQRSQWREEGGSDQQLQLRRSTPYEGGWGGWLQARDGGYVQAATEWRGRYGQLRAGIERDHDNRGYFAEAGGSVAFMDGTVIASRRIPDAFALVSTGVPDMPVLYENRVYGRTNGEGYLLVPELRGWQKNRLAVDPNGLGAGYMTSEIERFAVPADQAGVLVTFPVQRIQPALVTLLDSEGKPLPAGNSTRIHQNGDSRSLPVGFDGLTYIEDVTGGALIDVRRNGQSCTYRIEEPAAEIAGQVRITLAPERCSVDGEQR